MARKFNLDPSKFTDEQLYEIRRGEEQSVPVEFYANPHFTAREMAAYRSVLETALEFQASPDGHYVATDYGPEEVTYGFKSESNYEKYPDRICYVPENWDFQTDGPGYTANDILDLCGGDKDKADMVFALCDWQHPSTVLDEWGTDDSKALVEKKQEKIQKLESEIEGIRSQIHKNMPASLEDRIAAADLRRGAGTQKGAAPERDIQH